MIRRLNFLIPDFLKQIDKNLLLNHPGIWSTKVHFVAFYTLVAISFSTLLAILQVNVKDLSSPDSHTIFMFIPAAIGLIFWVFKIVRFNVERGFGISSGWEMFKKQLIYASCVAMFAIIPFYYGHVVSYFNANSLSDQELVEQTNVVNMAYANLTYKPNQAAPPYSNWTPVNLSGTLHGQIISGKDLYIRWNRMEQAERLRLLDNYQNILQKYNENRYHSLPSEDLISAYSNEYNVNNIASTGHFYDTKNALEDVNRAKSKHNHKSNFSDRDAARFIFMAFLVWMTIMISIRTSRKHSLTAIITGIVGMFAAGMIASFSREIFHTRPDDTISLLFFVTFGLLLLQSFMKKNSRKINFWKSVGLILAVAMTPFVFIVWDEFVDRSLNLETVIYGGILLSLLLWNLVYNRQFVSLKSAPSQD